jgi:hypothetical protein
MPTFYHISIRMCACILIPLQPFSMERKVLRDMCTYVVEPYGLLGTLQCLEECGRLSDLGLYAERNGYRANKIIFNTFSISGLQDIISRKFIILFWVPRSWQLPWLENTGQQQDREKYGYTNESWIGNCRFLRVTIKIEVTYWSGMSMNIALPGVTLYNGGGGW